MPRVLPRIFLGVAVVLSVAVAVIACVFLGLQRAETWATIAATLAVLTSIVSAWSSQRMLELSEDTKRPFPYPTFDLTSRYSMLQLRLSNSGGGPAFKVALQWHSPLQTTDGVPVKFVGGAGPDEIPILLPNESIAIPVGEAHSWFTANKDVLFSGHVHFEDASGRKLSHSFQLSAEKYRNSLTYESEALRTHFELQKLPEALDQVSRELKGISKSIGMITADAEADVPRDG